MSRLLTIGFLKSLGALVGCVEVPQYDPIRLSEESPPPPEPVCTVEQDVYVFHSGDASEISVKYHVQHATHFVFNGEQETSLRGETLVERPIEGVTDSAIYSAKASLLLEDGSRVDQSCPPVSVFVFGALRGVDILNTDFTFRAEVHDDDAKPVINGCAIVGEDKEGRVLESPVLENGRLNAERDGAEKWKVSVPFMFLPKRSDLFWRFECTNVEGARGASKRTPVTTSDEGLVGWYRFNDRENLGFDSSGYNNHGVVQGNPRFEQGENIIGGAVVMDGDVGDESSTDDAIVISENNQINPTEKITLEARFLVIEEVPKSHTVLWGGPGNGVHDGGGWSMNIENPPNIGGCYINPTNVSSNNVGSYNLRLNQYNHVICTYDGANAKFFLNGNEEPSKPTQGSLGNNRKMLIGYGNNGYFRGQIDEVAIYNRALTAEEARDSCKRLDPSGRACGAR